MDYLTLSTVHGASLFYSGNWLLINALILLMITDVITGLLKAFCKGQLWSKSALNGYMRKIGYLCVILAGNLIDVIFQMHGMFINSFVLFYIVGELTSVLENAIAMGIPVPKQLSDKLMMYNKGDVKHDEDTH
ncbi:holin family protein [Staphylococcus argensis]|uniref:Holin n=1 Tax=Staphylococcus argensis TaxID=1607738 RepID=A0A2K4FED1_9STAP|nr:phage holin family protein [Staphylococcus argensis]MCY6991128.1 phage holin family protein [Staphylococcus argensis]POA09647.1 holin [Staphylococcus argensis]